MKKEKRRIKRKGFAVAVGVQGESHSVIAFGQLFGQPNIILFMCSLKGKFCLADFVFIGQIVKFVVGKLNPKTLI